MNFAPLLPLLFFGLLGLGLFTSLYSLYKRHQAWTAFAQRNELTFFAGGPKISGRYKGQQLALEIERRGSGKSRHSVTVLRLDVSEVVSRKLSLEPEGLGDKFLKLFGRYDDELGDDKFDRFFDVKKLDPESATLLRHPEVQHQLFSVARRFPTFSIHQGQLSVETREVPSSVEALEAFIQPALTLAQTLESANRSPSRKQASS
jgi:hypothetical protein